MDNTQLAFQYATLSGLDIAALFCLGHRFDARLRSYRPGQGDSYVFEACGETARLHIGGRRWLTDLWQAPEGPVFVSDYAGTISVLADPAGEEWRVQSLDAELAGIDGRSAEDLWAWGRRGDDCLSFHFDGQGWREHPCPIHMTALDAASVDTGELVVAGGLNGGLARWSWDEGRWLEIRSPTRAGIVDLCVLSPDRIYAITASNQLLEGDAEALSLRAELPDRANALTRFGDELILGGAPGLGISTLSGGKLRPVQPQLDILALDGRGALLACSRDGVHMSDDLERWTGFGLDPLETLTGDKPVEWR